MVATAYRRRALEPASRRQGPRWNGLGSAAIAAALLATAAAPARADGSPADAVRSFYVPEPIGEASPEKRSRFTEPALSALAHNDRESKNGEEVGCIDGGLAIDAQDFDAAEVARTLTLQESVSGDEATVGARFRLFPEEADSGREVVWTLKRVDGAWKVADIAAPGSWRLSTMCR